MTKKLCSSIVISAPLNPPTFDQILPIIQAFLHDHQDSLTDLLNDKDDWLLINRDLNGRVRLILPERFKDSEQRQAWEKLASKLTEKLGKHGYPKNAAILFEANREQALQGASSYLVEGFNNVWVVDRLATEANWACIAPETKGAPRVVFFSIKGGVGRSTALAATAWSLAQAGKKVLVLDLDLESPGLSFALLPPDRQPMYGITDWLVEDLVDNGESIFDSMVATSNLSHDGEIHVVPAHGKDHGEYIAKLGRVWMPKLRADGTREKWSARLGRLLQALEERVQPDVILIDSRSGIDEIASACLTDLGANLILLFALEGEQTWNGYRMLFDQWQRANVTEKIRERLQIVAAMVPDRENYLEDLRESAYGIFVETLYEEIAAPKPEAIGLSANGKSWRVDDLIEGWNFDVTDESAPHSPWVVTWHPILAGQRSLYEWLNTAKNVETLVKLIFGPLISGVNDTIEARRTL